MVLHHVHHVPQVTTKQHQVNQHVLNVLWAHSHRLVVHPSVPIVSVVLRSTPQVHKYVSTVSPRTIKAFPVKLYVIHVKQVASLYPRNNHHVATVPQVASPTSQVPAIAHCVWLVAYSHRVVKPLVRYVWLVHTLVHLQVNHVAYVLLVLTLPTMVLLNVHHVLRVHTNHNPV